ncbi:hypothetical protein [Streptomyces sp.]|uniref:hypothetical protein n=1 Tax=Streptomyces sp. TaxID=1931 RepID=UPI002D76F84A|nr:hypothetical protein [Streptomyces sp.]HET6352648.1 hypothetical protein [Streptomyces sp.]
MPGHRHAESGRRPGYGRCRPSWVKALPASKTYTGKFVFAKGSWDEWTYNTEAKITVTYPAGSGNTVEGRADEGQQKGPGL